LQKGMWMYKAPPNLPEGEELKAASINLFFIFLSHAHNDIISPLGIRGHMLFYKSRPTRITLAHLNLTVVIKMANCRCQAIGGIKVFGQCLYLYSTEAPGVYPSVVTQIFRDSLRFFKLFAIRYNRKVKRLFFYFLNSNSGQSIHKLSRTYIKLGFKRPT